LNSRVSISEPLAAMKLSLAFDLALPEGRLVGLNMASGDSWVDPVLATLRPSEALLATKLRGFRRRSFVAGRATLAEALRRAGLPGGAILSDEHGAPMLPPGVAASLSHKNSLAVALVSEDCGQSLGVDLESLGPPRPLIARRVLREEERARYEALPEAERWPYLRRSFSAKESIYKALAPTLRRYIGFDEAAIRPQADGSLGIELALSCGASFRMTGRWLERDEWLVTVVTARQPLP